MVMKNKRGQFFLLSAVVLSAVILSLGTIANRADVNPEPRSFKDFSYEVKEEAGEVINAEIYGGFSGSANLSEFIKLLAGDIRDRDPYANFMFIYGDETLVHLENYGSILVRACVNDPDCDEDLVYGGGDKIEGKIYYGSISQDVNWNYDSVEVLWRATFDDDGGTDPITTIEAIIANRSFSFPIEDSRQVIFVIEKEVGNEKFIAVK
ncbi:MAG: hypothetical protein ABIF88_01500 [archaeon]